jgi:HAE1 family hydrophobic/amphiphilic exporter-1
VSEVSGGPPSGEAFNAQITGNDLVQLEKIATDFKNVLDTIPGTVNNDISIRKSAGEIVFKIDKNRLAEKGFSSASIGSALRSAVSGSEITKVLRSGEEVKINATFTDASIPTLDSLSNVSLVNQAGQSVPLKDLAEINLDESLASISHRDSQRIVTVTGAVSAGTLPNQVLKDFQDKVANYHLPDGYSVTYGGENEENAESVQSIINAMGITLILIIITLVIQFRQTFIVLATIPLAISGVFYGLSLIQLPLSFPGLIGTLALFGIVVKNAIILVDKMNLNLRAGIEFTEAIIDAAKSRVEAIFLTSFATILGILPITLTNELWRALGGALISGLTMSTFLTLFVVPILYYILVPHKDKKSAFNK